MLLAQTQLTVLWDLTGLLCKTGCHLHKSSACASAWSYFSTAGWCNCPCCALSHSSLPSSAFLLLRFPQNAAQLAVAPFILSTFICSLNLLESVLSHQVTKGDVQQLWICFVNSFCFWSEIQADYSWAPSDSSCFWKCSPGGFSPISSKGLYEAVVHSSSSLHG